MVNALSPEIIASEGRGDRARMLEYSLRACKFSALLIMLFAIPLVIMLAKRKEFLESHSERGLQSAN
jgi:hypothetical protein